MKKQTKKEIIEELTNEVRRLSIDLKIATNELQRERNLRELYFKIASDYNNALQSIKVSTEILHNKDRSDFIRID